MLKSLSDKFAGFAVGFYEWGAGWAGKLSGFFRLVPLSSVLTRHLSKRPALLGVELLVALSLTVTFYFLVRPTCLPYRDGNAVSKSVFCYLSEHVSPETKAQVQLNWKKRLAGPMLSAWLLDVKFKGQKEFDQNGFQDVFGFYHATWLFLLFLLLILYRRDALWIILGVFGGLMYNLTDPAHPPLLLSLGPAHDVLFHPGLPFVRQPANVVVAAGRVARWTLQGNDPLLCLVDFTGRTLDAEKESGGFCGNGDRHVCRE
jgi:hypothetical protein